MEIDKKSRTELKAYFVKNAVPTTGNFSDLIDAALNQKDDGIAKSADQPVQIAASTAGDKPAIHLYESFATDTKPAWVLSLQADGKKGLGIGDGDGNSRLFIDGATGNVGIGTADPVGYKLNVAGLVNVAGNLNVTGGLTVLNGQTVDKVTTGALAFPDGSVQTTALKVANGVWSSSGALVRVQSANTSLQAATYGMTKIVSVHASLSKIDAEHTANLRIMTSTTVASDGKSCTLKVESWADTTIWNFYVAWILFGY
ncbi:H-type lectin domain-containing protein [Sorangium sp. So ce260]|uniref:H-type lectin domain-containing protein n=1 Tax=Sorangium sp. So ce260 TaxID=3133291 RepID=UPI003F603C89